MALISLKISAKLKQKHGVGEIEVDQRFQNRTGSLLFDLREENKTDPPTYWFIAPTNKGRLLKICFVNRDGDQYVRTAYSPNEIELRVYRMKGNPSDF